MDCLPWLVCILKLEIAHSTIWILLKSHKENSSKSPATPCCKKARNTRAAVTGKRFNWFGFDISGMQSDLLKQAGFTFFISKTVLFKLLFDFLCFGTPCSQWTILAIRIGSKKVVLTVNFFPVHGACNTWSLQAMGFQRFKKLGSTLQDFYLLQIELLIVHQNTLTKHSNFSKII